MPNSIFISYRRSDSQHAAFAIADRMRWSFGADEVFLDRGSIEGGAVWPESIRTALGSAKVVLVIIGPTWLRAADKWGRRRIDDPEDWVRREICAALSAREARGITVVQVCLEGAAPPDAEALDEALRGLAALHAETLHNDGWEAGVERLLHLVSDKAGLRRTHREGGRNPNGSLARPQAKQSARTPMSDEQVRAAIAPLARWHLNWGPHPWGVAGQAQEIAKSYEFATFLDAVKFMSYAASTIDGWKPPHHPRWENQWKVVNVFFTTWDVDCRVTILDIDGARKLDALYFKFNREGN